LGEEGVEDDDERESGEEETRRDGADKQDKYFIPFTPPACSLC